MLFCRDHGDGSVLGIVLPLGAGGEFGEGGEEACIDELLKVGGRLEVRGLILGQGAVDLQQGGIGDGLVFPLINRAQIIDRGRGGM